jgi:CRP-like cAMP-binding protein
MLLVHLFIVFLFICFCQYLDTLSHFLMSDPTTPSMSMDTPVPSPSSMTSDSDVFPFPAGGRSASSVMYGGVGAVMPRPRPPGTARPSFSIADAVNTLIQQQVRGGNAAAAAASGANPLAALQAFHRASMLVANSGGDLQSHAREVRRHGSVMVSGSGGISGVSAPRHHINLEKFQLSQLAAQDAWRTVLRKDPGTRTSEEIILLFNWFKKHLARPQPGISETAQSSPQTSPRSSPTPVTAPSPTGGVTSPFLQSLPPLVLRGMCPDMQLIVLDKGEIVKLGHTKGWVEGYYIVLSPTGVAVLESEPDADSINSPNSRLQRSRTHSSHASRSLSPISPRNSLRHEHYSLNNSPINSPSPTPMHSRPHTAGSMDPSAPSRPNSGIILAPHAPSTLGSSRPSTAGVDSTMSADRNHSADMDDGDEDEQADTIAPALESRHGIGSSRPASGVSASPGQSTKAKPSQLSVSLSISIREQEDDAADEGVLNNEDLNKGLHLLGETPIPFKYVNDSRKRRWRMIPGGHGFGPASLLHACNDASRRGGLSAQLSEADTLTRQMQGTMPRNSTSPSAHSPTRGGEPHINSFTAGGSPIQSPRSLSRPHGTAQEVAVAGGLHGFVTVSQVKAIVGPVELLFIPSATFIQCVQRCALGKLNRRIEILRQCFLFNRWSFEKLSKFCMGLRRTHIPAGTPIYSQGDTVGGVFFLEKGEVLMEYDVDAGRSLMEKKPRGAAAKQGAIRVPPSSTEHMAGGTAFKQSVGHNVGAATGYFSITGENWMQMQAESAQFRSRTRSQRSIARGGSTLLKGTISSQSNASHRARRSDIENDPDAFMSSETDSGSEEEDTLVAHAMRALNEGIGLGVQIGSELSQKQRAPSEMLSELSEELAPEHKLMAAMQAQILAKRSSGAVSHAEALKRLRERNAQEHSDGSAMQRLKRGFKARPMPASFIVGGMTAAEKEMQELQALTDAAMERKAEEKLASEESMAPPLTAADVLARAAMHLPLAKPPLPPSTESGATDLLAEAKEADRSSRKDGLMWRIRNLQKAQVAARDQRMRLLALEQAEAALEKKEEEKAQRDEENRFKRMIRSNAANVKERNTSTLKEGANHAAQTLSCIHTHHSYITLFPFSTFLGGLTPPKPKRNHPHRPAIQFFKFFLLKPHAFRLHLCLEEMLDRDGIGSSTLVPTLSTGAVTDSSVSGLFVTFADSTVPTPVSFTWKAIPDTLSNALANHASSRLTHGNRAARGNVQNYRLDIDPTTDVAFRTPNNIALREECWYYICVQSMFSCTFTLKLDLLPCSANTKTPTTITALAADAPPSLTKQQSHPTSTVASFSSDASTNLIIDQGLLPHPSAESVFSNSRSLHRSHHIVPLCLFSGSRPTMLGDLELLCTSPIDCSSVRLTTARTLTDCVVLSMPRLMFFEHLRGELWARLQSLIRRQRKIYVQLVAKHSALKFGVGGTHASIRPTLHQRSMFVRAKLPDETNLDSASLLPSASRPKNYRILFGKLLGAASSALPSATSASARKETIPSINFMFPSEDDSTGEVEGTIENESTVTGLHPSPIASPRSRGTVALTPRRPRTPILWDSKKTFFELFGLDSMAPLLRTEEEQGRDWKPLPLDVPAPASTLEGIAIDEVGSAPLIQLSQAQEMRYHYRSHALSAAAAARKHEHRKKLLLLQRQVASDTNTERVDGNEANGSPDIDAYETSLFDALPVDWHRALLSDAEKLAVELSGLNAESLEKKLIEAQQMESVLEDEADQDVQFQERDETGDAVENQSGDELSSAVDDMKEIPLPALSMDWLPPDESCRDVANVTDLGDHTAKPSPRLPGSSPQHFFLSHGHHLLYAGFGSPSARRMDANPAPPAKHSALAEKMHIRSSRSGIGCRYDQIWHVERESERKWLAAHMRTQHIQQALSYMQNLSNALHATAVLPGIVSKAVKVLDRGIQSDNTDIADQKPINVENNAAMATTATSPKATMEGSNSPKKHSISASAAVTVPKPELAASIPVPSDFYPPSQLTQHSLSAKGSHILEAQLPHLATMVIAAEEGADPYGDDNLPSAAEQSQAIAAAVAAGSTNVVFPRRRIEGAPAFRSTPTVIRHSKFNDPAAVENVCDPEPTLNLFKISKKGVLESAKAISALTARQKQPNTKSESVEETLHPEGGAVASAVQTVRPATAPFADTTRFPPKQYPSFAPTGMAAASLDAHAHMPDEPFPTAPRNPIIFKHHSLTPRIEPSRTCRNSMWPPPEVPPAAERTVSIPQSFAHAREPELVHIRPWAPNRELYSSHLAHCIPLPPHSGLIGAQSAREQSRAHSARIRHRSAANSGASSARASRVTSANTRLDVACSHELAEVDANHAEVPEEKAINHTNFVRHERCESMSRGPTRHAPSHQRKPSRVTSAVSSAAATVVAAERLPSTSASVSAWPSDGATNSAPNSRPTSALVEEQIGTLSPSKPTKPQQKYRRHIRQPTKLLHSDAIELLAAHRTASTSSQHINGHSNSSMDHASKGVGDSIGASVSESPAEVAESTSGIPTVNLPFAMLYELNSENEKTEQRKETQFVAPAASITSSTIGGTTSVGGFMAAPALLVPGVHIRRPSSSPTHQRSSSLQEPTASTITHPQPTHRRGRSARMYAQDAEGKPISTPIPEADDVTGVDNVRAPSTNPVDVMPALDVMQSTLFKTAINFRARGHTRGDHSGGSGEIAPTTEISTADGPNISPIGAAPKGKRGQHQKNMSAFSEAIMRRFESSSRVQLIDEIYESTRDDVPSIVRVPLARVTSEELLLDHRGFPILDRPMYLQRALRDHRIDMMAQSPDPKVSQTASSLLRVESDEEKDAESEQLSMAERTARWTARMAKQEERVAVAHADMERKLRDALDEEELGESDDDENGVSHVERIRRRRLALERHQSLTMEEKMAAEGVDLDVEARALEERMTALAEETTELRDAPPGSGLIHAEIKLMRKAEMEARVRDMQWEIATPSAQQRRIAAMQALDTQHGSTGATDGVSASVANSDSAQLPDGKPSVHLRQPSVLQISFITDATMSPRGVKAGMDAEAGQNVIVQNNASVQARRPGMDGSAIAGSDKFRNRASRNKAALAEANRASVLAHVRRQLMAPLKAHHRGWSVSVQKNGSRLSDTSGLTATADATASMMHNEEESKFNGDSKLNIEPFDPASRTSTSHGPRPDSTLFQPTGFTGRACSDQPFSVTQMQLPLPQSISSQPHLSRFERVARRDALASARRVANAERILAAERDRLRTQQEEHQIRTTLISIQQHGNSLSSKHELLPRMATPSPAHISVLQPTAPNSAPLSRMQLISNAFLLDKSVQHPLQRLKIKLQQSQLRENRQKYALTRPHPTGNPQALP